MTRTSPNKLLQWPPGTDLKDFSGRLEEYRWVLTLVKEEQYRSRGLSEGLDVGGTNRSERVGRG